ncbi:hypothetical protein PRIPAC_84335 [Pristionchus pacificus]|uniref:SprT-like domain-containing protein n=1 Tax=Pristionchus pacificus TaxID=54126 RepID=A0A2A6BLG0_PRIPA|nr:hypothetical protein PRIPAC_84335 [Pristionchus pacificus]|eukprot:PDM66745.1 hypothetical protein PRIPAC_48162 [Pristionchus pacificus]
MASTASSTPSTPTTPWPWSANRDTPFDIDVVHLTDWFTYICEKYFSGVAFDRTQIEIVWSPSMVKQAGKCEFPTASSATIKLNRKLLESLPMEETVETLIRECIHAILHVSKASKDTFQLEARRIQAIDARLVCLDIETTSYGDKVNMLKKFHWRCSGRCSCERIPGLEKYVETGGWVSRARNRAPGSGDRDWQRHQAQCGGQFVPRRYRRGYGVAPIPQ